MKKKTYLREERDLLNLIAIRPPEVLAIDVDGTLAEFKVWRGYFRLGRPIARVVRWLRARKKAGAHIIIHSCRVSRADNSIFKASVNYLKEWLHKHRIPFDEIWTFSGKPGAAVYLDDHGYRVGCCECEKKLKVGRF